ncbi:MAG: 1-(5-phosphoribosyl)-5-[(5-phosphoribosylamino)methylideneamino] imidazole-4-carboxamide isomerase [Chloroflexi bacterium]|nr:1-(5-phosphoribosyl)-5-[(5-phosphoribosylamino)methylideneamino] imidazole-4-carboxamide isomerase [Chloroflexota bacterium]
MIIYPAIDLRGGMVVRLREGDPARQQTFSDDPLATAKGWRDQGASWLHLVNLDGAFDQANQTLRILEKIARLDISVQFGGGLRDLAALRQARDAGADRLVIGTMTARAPESALAAVQEFGAEAVCLALDARAGRVATHGWTEVSQHSPIALGSWLRERGARHALYTDVARDGGLRGVNIADTTALARQTGLRVIASGGVSRLDDIRLLAESGLIAGAVIGMALYKDEFTLADALAAAKGG